MKIFEKKELKKGSLLNRLLNKTVKENAFIELWNLFSAKDIGQISIEDVGKIAAGYRVDFRKDFNDRILDIYERLIMHFLKDKRLSDSEIESLQQAKKLLHLNDQDVDRVHREAAGTLYKAEVEKAIEDNKLSEEERAFLKKLQQDLKLSDKQAAAIYKESAANRVKKVLNDFISDERLSPREETELESIAKNLNLEISYDEKTHALLEKYKLFWQIENGDLPEIEVEINLHKNEKCFYCTSCEWYEQKRITERFNYSGPTLRLKIIKGVYWRAGSLKPQVISKDVWQPIDSGQLFVTNKRLIFMGSSTNKVVRFNRILDFQVFANGAEIRKDRGKNPFISFNNQNDLFALILGRVISE